MKITKEFLASLLNKHMGCRYTASHFYRTDGYEWFLVLEYEHPSCIIKYQKTAQYFCDIIPLDFVGVNPLFANDINKANIELRGIRDED